jgi:hypothetical protein
LISISLVTKMPVRVDRRTGQKTGAEAQMEAVSTSRAERTRERGAYQEGSKVGVVAARWERMDWRRQRERKMTLDGRS